MLDYQEIKDRYTWGIVRKKLVGNEAETVDKGRSQGQLDHVNNLGFYFLKKPLHRNKKAID